MYEEDIDLDKIYDDDIIMDDLSDEEIAFLESHDESRLEEIGEKTNDYYRSEVMFPDGEDD